MPTTILRRRAVLDATGKSNSVFYVDIAEGLFTPPILIGPRAVGWPEREVDALVRARIAGRTDDEIRALVKRLVAARRHAADDLVPPEASPPTLKTGATKP